MRGWWNMPCWNGLSADQQARLIERGNLPFGYEPEGTCQNPATVWIEQQSDGAPGPRFYCRPCAIVRLQFSPGDQVAFDYGDDENFGRVVEATRDEDGDPIPYGQIAVEFENGQGTWGAEHQLLRRITTP